MTANGVLVLEIGHERPFFEAVFPTLEVVWLTTSAGDDQVLLVTREALAAWATQTGFKPIASQTATGGGA